mgnify:CR=1 FL=1|tara:strand:- start:75 stop:728 length:654 start_codon:yes stop_codon:yes gene_type:complete
MNIFSNNGITIVNGVVVNGNVTGNSKKGNGKLSSEKRIISNFNAIKVTGSMDVIYQKNSIAELTVEADSNLLDNIETVVKGQTLHVKSKGSFSTNNRITIKCSSPSIEHVKISGSGDVVLQDIEEPELILQISGSGDIEVDGVCDDLTASVSGSGDIDAEELIAQHVVVNVAGSGDAVVTAKQSVAASVTGSGDIKVKGKPKQQKVSERGSGSVKIK